MRSEARAIPLPVWSNEQARDRQPLGRRAPPRAWYPATVLGSDESALDLGMEGRQTSVSPPAWLTFRPHHGHLGVSDGTGLRQPGHSTGSTPGPVKRPSQALLDGEALCAGLISGL
jgi:hypothetical protein